MGVSDAKHLEELESENAKLKRLLQAIAAHRNNAVGEIVMKLAKKFGAGPLRKLLLEKESRLHQQKKRQCCCTWNNQALG
jgi:hypothetical protein